MSSLTVRGLCGGPRAIMATVLLTGLNVYGAKESGRT